MWVVWLISVELLECVARLFSRDLCASCIASKALHQSKPYLVIASRTQNHNEIEPVGLAVIGWLHRNFVQISTG